MSCILCTKQSVFLGISLVGKTFLSAHSLSPFFVLKFKTTTVILLDNGVKMASKHRSFILLIFIINCIMKCSLNN